MRVENNYYKTAYFLGPSLSIGWIRQVEEVFNLGNSSLYNLWREQKLANYKQAVDNIIKIKDPSRLSQNEKLKILRNCRAANFAIYVSDKKIDMDGFG